MADKKTSSSLFPVNFLTGISDGLILPLMVCIIAGVLSAADSRYIAWIGTGVSLAGALVYSFARFRAEQEEIRHNHPACSESERKQETALLTHIGIPQEIVKEIEKEVQKEKNTWLKEIKENNMGWESPERIRALRGAVHTGAGFLLGGLLVSLPFWVDTTVNHLFLSVSVSFFCLVLTGIVTVSITGKKLLPTIMHQVVRGLLAYGAAFFLAYILSVMLT